MKPEALDTLFTTIANQRRRLLIEGVAELSDPVQYEELAEFIADRENGAMTSTSLNEDRDRVTIALDHVHLPKLEAAGVIDVNHDEQTVQRGDRFDPALSLLRRM